MDLDHPGVGRLGYPGAAYRHSATPWRIARPAPGVGEHNQELYGEELGVTAEQLRVLEETGVI